MLASVRLDAKTERLLARLAQETGRTRSEVIREAIARLAELPIAPSNRRPYLLAGDLVGCVRGGPGDLSTRTGQRFRELLQQRKSRPRR
jgi:hypothetical protein